MLRTLLALTLLTALPLAGCSFTEPTEAELEALIEAARSPEAEGVIVNLTSADVVVYAIDAELSARDDSIFGYGPVINEEYIVRHGEAAPLHVAGYRPGEHFGIRLIRVLGYRTVPPQSAWTTVDPSDFEANGRVVILRDFNESNL